MNTFITRYTDGVWFGTYGPIFTKTSEHQTLHDNAYQWLNEVIEYADFPARKEIITLYESAFNHLCKYLPSIHVRCGSIYDMLDVAAMEIAEDTMPKLIQVFKPLFNKYRTRHMPHIRDEELVMVLCAWYIKVATPIADVAANLACVVPNNCQQHEIWQAEFVLKLIHGHHTTEWFEEVVKKQKFHAETGQGLRAFVHYLDQIDLMAIRADDAIERVSKALDPLPEIKKKIITPATEEEDHDES